MSKPLSGTVLYPLYDDVVGIEASDAHNHPRIGKAMAPAFAEEALGDQERYSKISINKMVALLRNAGSSVPKDFAQPFKLAHVQNHWRSWLWGESLGGFDQQIYHPWVVTVFDGVKAIAFLQFVL